MLLDIFILTKILCYKHWMIANFSVKD